MDIGGRAVVKGNLKLTGKVPPGLDLRYSDIYLIRRTPGIAPPPAIAGMGFDIHHGRQAAWAKTSEGLIYLSTLSY